MPYRVVPCHALHLKQKQTPFRYEYNDHLALITLHTSSYPLPPHPKPVSTTSKVPHPTAISKAPAKTQGKKATKKPSKVSTDGKKKKCRTRGETEIYSSYIYKGMSIIFDLQLSMFIRSPCSVEAGSP